VRVYGYLGATNPEYSLTISGPLVADQYEANDSFAAASDLGTLGGFVATNLSIHAADNDDYFRFTAAANGTAQVDLSFLHALGDVDVRVFDAAQTEIGNSTGVDDTENVTFSVTQGATYYVRVYGFADATNPEYSLTISAPVPTLLAGDYNGDGAVDAGDYIVWRRTLGTTGVPAFSGADGDGDGTVDQDDFDVWRTNFGRTLGAGSANAGVMPEAPANSDAATDNNHARRWRTPARGAFESQAAEAHESALETWPAAGAGSERIGKDDVIGSRRYVRHEAARESPSHDALDEVFASAGLRANYRPSRASWIVGT
jgi:hypothetical protein